MAPAHAHRGLVAVRAGEPDGQGRREFSSGLLIAPGLVLTARHGVAADGVPLPGIEVCPVAGPRGQVQLGGPLPGSVAWVGGGGLDAALIELDSPPDEFLADFAVAGLGWAEPAGAEPVAVRVTGMPGFAAVATGEAAEVETARGALEPGSYTVSDRYAVNLDSAPGGWKDWRSVSGSPVTCADGGYLVGVTAWSDRPFEGRRLTAVPVRALLADPGFRAVVERHLGRVPEVEPAELAPLLGRPQLAGSIGALLRADAGITGFTGRDEELAFLQRWRDEPPAGGPDVKVLLVTGIGGEGKTRLALEFLARSKATGWTGGLLSALPEDAAGFRPGVPLLLVIDYAAARADGVTVLVRAVARARPPAGVRFLLLARTAGEWWTDLGADLADTVPGLDDAVLPLRPLLAAAPGASVAADLARATAMALAPYLRPFTGRGEDELRAAAAALTIPRLAGPLAGHALTVQMSALAALLEAVSPSRTDSGGPAKPVEDTLLWHERVYRDRLAAKRGLDGLRPVRDRAVVGAALFGARGPTQPGARSAACSIVTAALPELGGTASRQRNVADWIAELYPPAGTEPGADLEYWGQVLPDRLAEFLAARVLAAEQVPTNEADGLLQSLARRSDPAGTRRALLILTRACAHDRRAADWIVQLVTALPEPTASIALEVATYAEDPSPLRAALVHLGQVNPESLRAAAHSATSALPEFSLQRLESSASLTAQLALVLRDLADRNRDAYLPDLAGSLNNHAVRLADAGRHEEALAASAQALDARRELAARNRDAYLPDLAGSLNTHANRLADAGRHEEALAASAQALDAFTELADRNRDAYLPDLATSLNTHANRLAGAGRHEEALAASAQALDARRELADRNRDAYLPELVRSLWARGVVLSRCGRFGEAALLCVEAINNADGLPDYPRVPFVKAISGALREAYRGDPEAVEAAYQEAAGTALPEEWK